MGLSQLMEAGGQKPQGMLGWECKCVCATREQVFCFYDSTVYINPPPRANKMVTYDLLILFGLTF
jgi:hypothetical protein